MTCIAPRCAAAREPGSLFCRLHEAAPAGQRGGWLSAEKRRRMRAAHPDQPLDCSNVARRLWIGSKPPFDRPLPEFDVLVLCAQELQPAQLAFQGRVVRCPIPDGALDRQEIRRVLVAGHAVAESLTAGRRVLVTCAAGINRSALVTCFGLGLVTRMSAAELVELVRKRRRPECLSNTHFVAMLDRYIGTRRGNNPQP